MSADAVIQVDRVSKQYRLGEVSTGSLGHDLNRWWHRLRGRSDPYLRVTETNVRESRSAAGGGYVWALRDLSFEVSRGEVLGIIGRNGAGKSTLLKILSQITTPTTGEVRIRGRIASLLEVGTGFHQDLTGRENIFMNGAILGMSRQEIQSKLDAIVSFSGCERYIDTPVKRYSSGMVVRLGFSVAAHLEPDILVVDEVLAVGDAEFQKKCVGKMQDVASHGRTVLFVSHNMRVISRLTRRCLVLDQGTLAFEGDTEEAIPRCTGAGETAPPAGRRPVESLPCDQRMVMNPGLVFLSLGVVSLRGGVQPYGEALVLDVEIQVDRSQSACLGYTVCGVTGEGLISGWSAPWVLERAGVHRTRLILRDLGLAPGRYGLHLALQEGARGDPPRPCDLVMGWGHFEVRASEGGSAPPYTWSPAWGAVVHHASELEEHP